LRSSNWKILNMRDVAEAFLLGFVLGVSALVVLGSEITKELRSAKTELAGILERLAEAVETRGAEALRRLVLKAASRRRTKQVRRRRALIES
jgi:hypothetical protein